MSLFNQFYTGSMIAQVILSTMVTWSIHRCHIAGLDGTPTGRHLYWYSPLCVDRHQFLQRIFEEQLLACALQVNLREALSSGQDVKTSQATSSLIKIVDTLIVYILAISSLHKFPWQTSKELHRFISRSSPTLAIFSKTAKFQQQQKKPKDIVSRFLLLHSDLSALSCMDHADAH